MEKNNDVESGQYQTWVDPRPNCERTIRIEINQKVDQKMIKQNNQEVDQEMIKKIDEMKLELRRIYDLYVNSQKELYNELDKNMNDSDRQRLHGYQQLINEQLANIKVDDRGEAEKQIRIEIPQSMDYKINKLNGQIKLFNDMYAETQLKLNLARQQNHNLAQQQNLQNLAQQQNQNLARQQNMQNLALQHKIRIWLSNKIRIWLGSTKSKSGLAQQNQNLAQQQNQQNLAQQQNQQNLAWHSKISRIWLSSKISRIWL